MVASILVGMLCAHLLFFAAMFLLISTRLHGKKLGMDFFALGNLLLGLAYVLQLAEGGPAWSAMSVVNHTLTIASPLAYACGAMRFFGYAGALVGPLTASAAAYAGAQVLVHWGLGPVARYAMLAGASALLFLAMGIAIVRGVRSFARDLQREMVFFALLLAGICVLNALKFLRIVDGGLEALHMDSRFQLVFYIYMCSLTTVLPPSIVWLVLRRLTDELRQIAACDPLTQLLNRRGLVQSLELHFKARRAAPMCLLLVDVDHFKRINDTHGHHVGDAVLCHVAQVLHRAMRQGDLTGRIGGEEFVAICRDTDAAGGLRLAERLRAQIEGEAIEVAGCTRALRVTATIGVSRQFDTAQALDSALQEADAALYRGKARGRNRVESSRDHILELQAAAA